MTFRRDAIDDLYAIYSAGGRINGERSNAVDSRLYGRYGDPANHVEFPRELERRAKIKQDRKNKKMKYRWKGK